MMTLEEYVTTLEDMRQPYKDLFEDEMRNTPPSELKNFLGRVRRFAKKIGVEEKLFYDTQHEESSGSDLGGEAEQPCKHNKNEGFFKDMPGDERAVGGTEQAGKRKNGGTK